MSSYDTESVLEPFGETVDFGDADNDIDAHPRHRHGSEDTDTAPLTDQLLPDHNNGTQSDSDTNLHINNC